MPRTSNAERVIIKVFWLSTILVLFFSIFFVVSAHDIMSSDFVSFVTGALAIRRGMGMSLYELITQFVIQQQIINPIINPGLLPFRNLPVFAALIIPLTYLPLVTGYKFWASLLIVIMLLAERLCLRVFKNIGRYRFIALFLPLLYYPSLVSIIQAQITPLILLIFILIYKFAKSEKYFLAGIISGFLLIKLQYVLAVPFLFMIVRERKVFLRGFITSSLAIIFLSVIISGPGFITSYPRFLVQTETPFFGSTPGNMFTVYPLLISLADLLRLPGHLALVLNAALYLVILVLFAREVKKVSFDKAFAALILLSVVFSVHALVHDQIVLLVPILILLNLQYKMRKGKEKSLILAIALFLVIYPALPDLFFFGQAYWVSLSVLIPGLYLLKPTFRNSSQAGYP